VALGFNQDDAAAMTDSLCMGPPGILNATLPFVGRLTRSIPCLKPMPHFGNTCKIATVEFCQSSNYRSGMQDWLVWEKSNRFPFL